MEGKGWVAEYFLTRLPIRNTGGITEYGTPFQQSCNCKPFCSNPTENISISTRPQDLTRSAFIDHTLH